MKHLQALTFKQLRALAAVAEHGSITAAAERLGLTPPAVHTQLRGLEENLQANLLNRGESRGPKLTPEGEIVLQAQKEIEVALAKCMTKLTALKAGQSGAVILGVVSTGKYFAPQLVADLRRAMPDIEVRLIVGNRTEIIEALSQNAIELAIMGRPPREPKVASQAIGDHPHVLIAAPDHPLAQANAIDPDDLFEQTFIAREEGSGTRILMTRFLDRIGDGAPYALIEMGSNETIKQAVMACLGVAIISQHTVTEELRTGRLVTLNVLGMPVMRQWYLLHRSDLEMSPTISAIHDQIAAMKGSFLPRL